MRHTSTDSQLHLLQIFSTRRTDVARAIRSSSSGTFSVASSRRRSCAGWSRELSRSRISSSVNPTYRRALPEIARPAPCRRPRGRHGARSNRPRGASVTREIPRLMLAASGSASSRRATEIAADLATTFNAQLTLLHVAVPLTSVPRPGPPPAHAGQPHRTVSPSWRSRLRLSSTPTAPTSFPSLIRKM
jgi:nucleotide-binding universal stress UspA family protein